MAEDIDMPDAGAVVEESLTIAVAEDTQPELGSQKAADSGDNEASGEEDESESESDGEPYLAVTRERRSNAGNRMAKLLQLAEAEQDAEEYGEIFQEAANDQEFEEEDENDEDVNMDSSSEEDEAEGEQDDDAAEKELKKQEKRENAKKQKRQSLLQQMMKKRTGTMAASAVASDAAGPSTTPTPPRPKKSERVSWLPEDDQQATRASSRKLAVINKQATNERLKEKEKHRLKTVEVMKAAEQRKEALKPKAMTQADRLAEAARIERENSRSVRKWEEVERRKEEERKARIAAAKNRKLEGPVISYWSGPALWLGDRRVHVGKGKQVNEFLMDSKRGKDHPDEVSVHADEPQLSLAEDTPGDVTMGEDEPQLSTLAESQPAAEAEVHDRLTPSSEVKADASIPNPTAPEQESGKLSDTHQDSKQQDQQQDQQPDQRPDQELERQPEEQPGGRTGGEPEGEPEKQPGERPGSSQLPNAPATDSPAPAPVSTPQNDAQHGATLSEVLLQQSSLVVPAESKPTSTPIPTDSIPPEEKPVEQEPAVKELAARSLVVLVDFSPEPKPKDRDALLRALLSTPDEPYIPPPISKWSNKIQAAKKPVCAVTGQEARYRDPITGLPYLDGFALKAIRRLAQGNCVWSETLECWLGEHVKPAVGVPPGFDDPAKVRKKDETADAPKADAAEKDVPA